jgi:O-antigen ligase
LAYILGTVFLLQIDAYLYTLRIIDVRPWMIFFVSFACFCATQCVRRWHQIAKLRVSREALLLMSCLAVYIVVQLLGVYSWSALPDDPTILVFWAYMVALVAFGGLIELEIGDKRFAFFMFLLVCSVGLIAVYSASPVSQALVISEGPRATGTLRNPNAAAFVVVALTVGAIRWNWRNFEFRNVFAMLMACLGVVLTGSRGGMLSLLIVIGMYAAQWIVSARSWSLVPTRMATALLIGMSASAVLLYGIISLRYGAVGGSGALSLAFDDNQRFTALRIAWELAGQKPWWGNGTGFVYTQVLGPHNMVMRTLVEGGIVGLVAFLLLPMSLLWTARARDDWGLAALTVAALIMSLTTHNLTEDRTLLLIFGVMLVPIRSRAMGRIELRVSATSDQAAGPHLGAGERSSNEEHA